MANDAEALLRRRVLPLAEFAAEIVGGAGRAGRLSLAERLRRYGSKVVPIPVPLARGESAEAYEAAFAAWLSERRASAVVHPRGSLESARHERTMRYTYAVTLARAFLAKAPRGSAENRSHETDLEDGEEIEDTTATSAEKEPYGLELLPREVLIASKVVSLAEYRAEIESGTYREPALLTPEEKQRRFGSPVEPIAVPLAPGETLEQYEDRFLTWLVREQRMTLCALRCHDERNLERLKRLEFAKLNAQGLQRFVPPGTPPAKRPPPSTSDRFSWAKKTKSDTVPEDTRRKDPTLDAVAPTCPGNSSLTDCIACQCEQCLQSGMRILSDQITACENKPSRECQCSVIDLTGARSPSDTHVDRMELPWDDAVTRQLQRAYDEINESILQNGTALEIEEARLRTPSGELTIHDCIRLQRENEEMRELIESEFPRRTAAVVLLIVYLWRYDPRELRKMLGDRAASDLAHVQQRIHERLAELAERGTTKNADHIRLLRLQQLELLIHVDKRVQQGIQAVISVAAGGDWPDPEEPFK